MKVEVGMKVRIIKYNVTHRLFKTTIGMRNMVGKIWKISSISKSKKGSTIRINGWTWSPDDLDPVLQPLDIKEEQKSELFDPSNLDIG